MKNNKEYAEKEILFSAVSEQELAKYDKDAAFAIFLQQVAKTKSKYRRIHWLQYAAVVSIVLSISFLSYKVGVFNVKSAFNDIIVEAPQGSRSQTTLPDGTKVWLNAGSKIMYSQGFGYNVRVVRLIGEGYFEVAHNERLPFSVETNNVRVRVLGTKFNIRNYPTDADAIISLTEGKIELRDSLKTNSESLLMKPGQRAIVSKGTGEIDIQEYTVSNSIQWIRGRLVYDGDTLEDIVKDLERSYNVSIEIQHSNLRKLHFHGEFVRHEQSLQDILDALTATGKINYKRDGLNITLF